MDIKAATRAAVHEDLKRYSYAELEKLSGVNRGLFWRCENKPNGYSPLVAAYYEITSEPEGVKQWKARVPDELFYKLQEVQQRTGLTRAELLARWAAMEDRLCQSS